MIRIAGPNLYRVLFKINGIETLFQKLIVARSEKELMQMIDNVLDIEIVETDISMWVPEQYASQDDRPLAAADKGRE